MSDIDRLRLFQGTLTMPGSGAPANGAAPHVRIPGEAESRPLGTTDERIAAMNKLGEAMRAATPAGQLHDFAYAVSVIAAQAVGDPSIESKKAMRALVGNLYGFSERIR